jgi:uncharacterized C2H2 Zn-finger protein
MPIYQCTICKKTFEDKTDYTRHVSKKYPCKKEDNTGDIINNIQINENNTYECLKCHKCFPYKSQCIRHVNSKFDCIVKTINDTNNDTNNNLLNDTENDINNDTNNNSLITIEKEYRCDKCFKTYSTKKTLNRHINGFCKGLSLDNAEKMLDTINDLKKELNDTKLINTTNIGNINGNQNTMINSNNTQNITINAYGKEDLSHITDNDYKKIFNKCMSAIPMLIELIHFNENKKENANVCISNIKSPNAHIYDGNKWILRKKNEIIDDLYDNNCSLILDKFDNLKNILNQKTIDTFNYFMEKYDTALMKKNVEDKIELLLYNNRDMVTK